MSGAGTIKTVRTVRGARVWVQRADIGGQRHLGDVERRQRPSHIRRGRMQVDPWWIAVPSGTAEPLLDVHGETRFFQTRRDAIAALRQYEEGR